MKYPRLPKEKWANKVTLPKQQEEIRKFYSECKNTRATAREFGVSRSVVVRAVDPERALERDKRARAKVLERYHTDAEYRSKVKEQVKVNQRGLRKRNDKLVPYGVSYQKERYASTFEVRQKVSIYN